MRNQINKITKRHSTKAERRFMEFLKKFHIPFKSKVLVQGREVDFIIEKYAIEIDGHLQDANKNKMLLDKGFIPIHFNNWATSQMHEWLKNIWLTK